MSGASRAAALALAALLALACGAKQRAAPHLAKAEQLADAGKLDDAMIELRSALSAEPKSADVNYRLARLLHRQGQMPDAVYFYEEALRLDPHHEDAALGLAFVMLGDDAGYAQRLVDGVIARNPKNSLAWVRRSDIALARGDADAALAAVLTASELAPKSARVQLQLGLVQRARIRKATLLNQPVPDELYQQALSAFESARDGEDDSRNHENVVNAWVERANTLASWPAHAGEAPQAYREAFAAATKLGGSQDIALDATLAEARRLDDHALQQWALERAVEVHPDRLDLWRQLARATDPAGAKESPALARMLRAQPRNGKAHALYARDLAARGRAPDAIAHLTAVAGKVDAPAVPLLAVVEIALDAKDDANAQRAGARLAKDHAGSFEDLVARAALARAARDFKGAGDAIASALDRYGVDPQLELRLAEMRLMQGDSAATLEATERGLAAAKARELKLGLLRVQARAQIGRGAYAAAADSFRKMVDLAGGKIAGADLVPYASVLYATDRAAGARSLLESALQADPAPVDAVLLFAQREGDRDAARAEKLVTAALARFPEHAGLLEQAARFDIADGRAAQAKARLAAAIAAAPNFAPLHVTLARVLLETGDAAGAVKSAEEAMRLDPENPDALSARVLVAAYGQLGRTDEAIQHLEDSQRAGKLGIGGQVLLARLLTEAGRREPAIAVLEGALAKSPDLAGAKNDLAYLLIAANRDLDRALSLAQEARAALPTIATVADTLGYAYLAKKLPDAALPQFQEAIQLAQPKSPEWGLAQVHLALAYQQLGRSADAIAAAQAALEASTFPEQDQAHALLAKLQKPGVSKR